VAKRSLASSGLGARSDQCVADLLANTPPVLAARGMRTVAVAIGATGAAAIDRDPPGDITGR